MITLHNGDCIEYMKTLPDKCIDFNCTDIPYANVNRDSGGLRNLDKGKADILTFDLQEFLNQVYRITTNSILIFCGKEQFSEIYSFFSHKQELMGGGHRSSYHIRKIKPFSNERSICIFKWC